MRRSKSQSERNHTQPHHCWAEQSPMSKNSYTAKEAKGHNPKPHLPSPQNSFLSTKENLPSKQTLELHLGWPSKTLDKLSKNVSKFNPNSTGGHTIQAHLQDIDFYLEMRPHVTDRDRLYLLRATSSSEVRNFLDRQPSRTKSDYQLLREVLIKEFTDPDSEHGLLTALETKQGRQEAPQAYYNRLRQAYFGAHNEPDLEEDVNFKSLFLRNLHPGVSHHLGVMACPRSMTIQQLRDLTQKAYNKQKMASKKVTKHPHSWTLSTKTQALHWTTPRCITKPESSIKSTENVIPMSTKAISPTSGKNPWDQPRFSRTQKIATTGNLTRHPKVIAWLIQEHLVGLSDNETHLSITQTCTVLSMLQNHTAYRQKTWNKSWANWTSSFKISWTRMTTKLSHARCDQRQNGRPMIAWYTTISEMTSTCSTTTQDEASLSWPTVDENWGTREHHLTHPSLTSKLLNELQLLEPHSCLCNSNHQSTEGQKVCHIQKVAQEECNKGDKVCSPASHSHAKLPPTVC